MFVGLLRVTDSTPLILLMRYAVRYSYDNMSWQILTAISVLTLSASVLLQRVLLSKDRLDPYSYAVVFQTLVGAILMVAAVLAGFSLANIEAVITPALLSIVAFGVGHIAYAKTLQTVEASAFSVLFATQAIWIMLLGIVLFNESLAPLQLVGTLLIFGSIGIVFKNIRSLKLDKGTGLGLLTGILFGVAITSWSYVGRYVDGLSWAAISFVGTALVVLLIRPRSITKVHSMFKPKIAATLFLLAVFYAIGSVAMLFAYKEGTFSVVTPLRQTSIIATTLLALLFLAKERTRVGTKLLAALVCFIGVVLIVV
jgi:drug/metabolite transporter (DMT)-like permease